MFLVWCGLRIQYNVAIQIESYLLFRDFLEKLVDNEVEGDEAVLDQELNQVWPTSLYPIANSSPSNVLWWVMNTWMFLEE